MSVPVRAMILAAGRGTRLRPYTESVPKCMTVVDGRPVLEHAIRHLASYGVTEVVINLHHLPGPVVEHFGDGRQLGVHIAWSPEEALLGTAGGVGHARSHFPERFLVWYGDNLSTIRLDRLAELHQRLGADATVALFHRQDVGSSGIVDVDEEGRIHRFLEKPRPDQVFSHWVNAGVYVVEPAVLDAVPHQVEYDFGRQVFPALLTSGGRLGGYRMGTDEQLQWIDSPEDLAQVTAARSLQP